MKLSSRMLYSSAEVRSAIVSLFRVAGAKRIAISAFVGDGAEAYLPYPKGLRLICCPAPGATNPNTLRRLISNGVKVEFVDRLHMKIYWSDDRGAVVTSANLSTNAMGIGGLKEAGVLLPANAIDIQRILKHLKTRPAKPELRRLDIGHREYVKRLPKPPGKRTNNSYIEWFESPARELWKFFVYTELSYDLSDTAVQTVKLEFGRKPYNWIWSELPRVRENDWILCVYRRGKRVNQIHWLIADRVFNVPKSDRNFDPEYPYEVVQIHEPKRYPPSPFSIDRQFRSALKRIVLSNDSRETATPRALTTAVLSKLYDAVR
jgi:hypothetical protein